MAIHRASASDNMVYLNMVIFANTTLVICPELELLAVRPAARSGVRSVLSAASMAALLPVRLLDLLIGRAIWQLHL